MKRASERVFTEQALPKLKVLEGGYANDPDDPGGETNHGVTKAVARAYGYRGEMRDMPYETAVDIFKERYWETQRLAEVAYHSVDVALELFEAGIHVGIQLPAMWLQSWLNAFNHDNQYGQDLVVDGIIGRLTIARLDAFLFHRSSTNGNIQLLRGLNASQAQHYLTTNNRKYIYGWMANRVVI